MTLAVVIMAIVIVGVGAGTYFAFNGKTSSNAPSAHTLSCAPQGSAICAGLTGGHDLYLSEPFRSAEANFSIPFTTQIATPATIEWYNYNFGDGVTLNTTHPQVSHTYATAGTYIASVTAGIKGSNVIHDNFNRLLIVTVSANNPGTSALEIPHATFTLAANSSSSKNPTGLLASASDTVTVNGTYTSAPSDSAATEIAPTFTYSSGDKVTAPVNGATFAQATVSFANAGANWVTFVGGATVGSTTYAEDYTWSVFVAPAGVHLGWVASGSGQLGSAGAAGSGAGGPSSGGGSPTLTSKHAGTLDIYEYFPGGAQSEDPSWDYETVGFEPIINVYQTLITYNGSDTGSSPSDFVPELATCVPGSVQCTQLYGGGFTGAGIDGNNYTFVISKTARFYDPSTGNSWPVYPSDVVFSLARTMAFSTGEGWGSTNGWIVTQALVGNGSSTWDGGLHFPANNTPQNVLNAISVNDSAWCPSAAMTSADGCVTFHADAGPAGSPPLAWPYFLELVADGLGSSITPCGWFSASAQAAGVPYWTQGNVSGSGDQPCTLPGGATSTTDPAFSTAVAAIPANGWDSWEQAVSGPNVGNVNYNMVGSGPYYMKNYQAGNSYLLAANPAYVAPCNWQGCEPEPGTYASTVSVLWEQTATPGETAYKAGIADAASVPLPDLSLLLSLVNQGTVSLTSFPTISIFFFPFDMNFDSTAAAALNTGENVGSTFFSELGVRQFLVNAWPYTTIQNTINERDGLTFYNNYGGAIPPGMQYYQGNISWPASDPVANPTIVGSAAWWWAQATNSSSPFYDSQLSTCTTSAPCYAPVEGQTGAPDVDERISLWSQEVNTLSGGKLQIAAADEPFVDNVIDSVTKAPGQNPLGNYLLGWAPDYPDPTDYTTPMYLTNSTYTHSDAVEQQLSSISQGFNSSSCHSYTDYGYWAVQANNHAIPNDCQGAAYASMQFALQIAAHDANTNTRNILYWQIESIANGLALYLWFGEQNTILSSAAYLNVGSFNENVTIGGGNDNTWYSVTYAATGNGATD